MLALWKDIEENTAVQIGKFHDIFLIAPSETPEINCGTVATRRIKMSSIDSSAMGNQWN
jgi:hypothetical protein